MFVTTAIVGMEREERAVVLVRLDHEPFARAEARVRGVVPEDAADDQRRIEAGLRRERVAIIAEVVVFPWVPATPTAALEAGDLAEHLGAPDDGNAQPPRAPRARGGPSGWPTR